MNLYPLEKFGQAIATLNAGTDKRKALEAAFLYSLLYVEPEYVPADLADDVRRMHKLLAVADTVQTANKRDTVAIAIENLSDTQVQEAVELVHAIHARLEKAAAIE